MKEIIDFAGNEVEIGNLVFTSLTPSKQIIFKIGRIKGISLYFKSQDIIKSSNQFKKYIKPLIEGMGDKLELYQSSNKVIKL